MTKLFVVSASRVDGRSAAAQSLHAEPRLPRNRTVTRLGPVSQRTTTAPHQLKGFLQIFNYTLSENL